MTRYNYEKDCHLALATGDDAGAGSGLTAWRNLDAEYIAGELIPCDKLLGWNNTLPTYETEETGSMDTTLTKDRYSTKRKEGVWKSKHEYQTIQFLFWLMQTPGTPTNEGVPAGYNTTTLTKGLTETPLWHGLNFEREGITSNELRYAMMGLLPSDLTINVGANKEEVMATQEITIPYSFAKFGVTEIAPQTPRASVLGSKRKSWNHLVTGNGAGRDPSGLKYNGNNLEVDVKHVSLKFHRDYMFGPSDATGYPIDGYLTGWNYEFVLELNPIGDLWYTVNRTAKEDYAGDLDYIFAFIADATNDKHTYTYDKMFMVPVDEVNDWNKYTESYSVTFKPFDTTSSLSVVGIGNLDNTHFENP